MGNELCSQALKAFLQSLRESFDILPSEEGCVIVTPFLRSDNECVEIELIPQPNGGVKITDNCETIDYLFVNGLNISRSKELQRQIRRITKRFGVDLSGDEFVRLVNFGELGDAIHSFLGAVQEASYLIYRKVRRPPVTFDEQVEKFLIANDVAYDTEFKLQGKTREHIFRFYINERHQMLAEPLTATSYHAALVKAERLAYRWIDIRDLWPVHQKVAVIDDLDKRSEFWVGNPLNILLEYSNHVIRWSQNEELMMVLSRQNETK